MWEANFYKKRTYGLGDMKVFSLRTEMGQLKNFLFQSFFDQTFL